MDAAECWHWYAGGPLVLSLSAEGSDSQESLIGPDLSAGQEPFGLVPPGWWQAARPLAGWVLVGCTVSPGFEFARFEMAPPGWAPHGG